MKVSINGCLPDSIEILKSKTDLDFSEVPVRLKWDEEISLSVDTVTKKVKILNGEIVKMIFSNIKQFLTYYEGLEIINEARDIDENNH